jgi:hypothetical protein
MATPAYACEMHEPLDINDIKNADVVAIGRIENYELVRFQRYPNAEYARFEVYIDKLIKGQPPRKVAVTWSNSTFGIPESRQSGPFLIALTNPTPSNVSIFGPAERDSFSVVQGVCSSPFMLNPSAEVVSLVRRVFNGEKVDQTQLRGSLFVEPSISVFEKLKPHWKAIGASLAGILFLGFLGVTLVQHRRQKTN